MRKAKVLYQNKWAGTLTEDEEGYHFQYEETYLENKNVPVSLTLPLQQEPYHSNILFPFFDGLIPEGWILEIVEKNWKVNEKDRMGVLLVACRDCIGAVSIEPHA
ncbi:HipA N-terminal domain-containing protein [Marinoscillum furvescens]|uniref:Serine/threonine-protein kinase HipA n=1 Tax=Marinoscillum furvescens DSM 4134 TaxID=1122208 RepID=A0A3D9LL22_MARFU|nr:HipA N-terminal domain-containing protein [Marinoscillum furvescens]REE05962.1 serine/threonine-protein kinase HipA [Marinoscillum furvescens DSM 4134]